MKTMNNLKDKYMRTKYILVILILATMFSCKEKSVDEVFLSEDAMPAATYMKNNPEEFSMWVDLLEYTDLFNALNLSTNYTCFVPTNEAMQQYLQLKGKSTVRDFDLAFATALVKYHVIKTNGKRYTQSYFENGVISDTTASGDNLSIEIREGGINAIYVNGEAHIKQLDIEVTNAIIHRIDKVLDPITETIWDKLAANANYSIMKDALQATGYDTLLNQVKYKSTLLVVPNSILSAMGITNTATLSSYLGAGNDYTNTENLVNKFIAYHILPQRLSFSELSTFSTTTLSKNINTKATNEIINIADLSGTLYLNWDEANTTGVKLAAINSNCKNGIIHELDKPMFLFSPKPASYIWELTDYPELATLFPTVYRRTTLTSNSTNNISEGSVTCYKWQTVLPDNMNSSVKYYVHKNSEERYKALNADYLRLKLGLYGWIEMKTPAIVKGTYNLKLFFHSPKSTAYKFTFVLDGNIIGIITLPSNASKDLYMTDYPIATNRVFSATTEHTIRIIASDNSEYELDYILFQPVN
jgi:uncharacterized surface protein with fasciclin (FAS1) repeats